MNALLLTVALLGQVDYPVIAVRSSLSDTTVKGRFPEVFNAAMHPVSDLVNLTTGQIIGSGNETDALFDPMMSLDGEWLYYVRVPNTAQRNNQRGSPVGFPYAGADIYRTHLTTGQTVRITGQHWTPPTSMGPWLDNPSQTPPHGSSSVGFGYGVVNLGPQPLPGGKIAFTSNRQGYGPPKGFAGPHQQTFVLDDIPGTTDHDGETDRNLECTGHHHVSSALHPTLLTNGELAYSSHESQGLRDPRLWALWHMKPDGRGWGPIYSGYVPATAIHFQAQRSDKSVVGTFYYNLNNWGFGAFFGAPLEPALPTFLSPNPADNPALISGWFYGVVKTPKPVQFSTMRRGMESLTPWSTMEDVAGGYFDVDRFVPLGKVVHPKGAPNNDLLCTYSPGYVNQLNRPTSEGPHSKVARINGPNVEDVEILFEHPDYHYTQPIAAVPWVDIYGAPPVEHAFCPNPTGTPFGRLQLSSSHLGQWKPETNDPGTQGHWSGHPQDIPAGLDIVAFEPVLAGTYWTYPDGGWSNAAKERVRVLARVMFDEMDRPAGDTSADILIPADTPYGMRIFADDGRTIAFSQTWKQTRPGEVQHCGGCHNHSGDYIPFEGTYASDKQPFDFRSFQVRTPEFNRDVLPIFQAKCNHCHNETHPVKLDASLATSVYVKPSMAYASRLSKAIHGEGATQQMPLDEPPLTDEEKRKIDEWIDYFCLVSTFDEASGKGAWADITKPTVYVPRSGALNIGAWDYRSAVTVQAEHNGQPLTLPEPVDGVYQTGVTLAEGDRVKVTATDGAGNVHTVERFVRATGEPPPDPDPTIAELRAEVQRLTDKINAAKAALEAAKAALED